MGATLQGVARRRALALPRVPLLIKAAFAAVGANPVGGAMMEFARGRPRGFTRPPVGALARNRGAEAGQGRSGARKTPPGFRVTGFGVGHHVAGKNDFFVVRGRKGFSRWGVVGVGVGGLGLIGGLVGLLRRLLLLSCFGLLLGLVLVGIVWCLLLWL